MKTIKRKNLPYGQFNYSVKIIIEKRKTIIRSKKYLFYSDDSTKPIYVNTKNQYKRYVEYYKYLKKLYRRAKEWDFDSFYEDIKSHSFGKTTFSMRKENPNKINRNFHITLYFTDFEDIFMMMLKYKDMINSVQKYEVDKK